MNDGPIKLLEVSNSAHHWSVDDMLRDALKDKGSITPNKAILVMCEFKSGIGKEDDELTITVLKSGCNDIEAVGLLDFAIDTLEDKTRR